MIVDVVRLRQRGTKLPADKLEAPIRGILRMSYWQCSGNSTTPAGRIRRISLLAINGDKPPFTATLLPSLDLAHIVQLREGSMVVAGRESIFDRDDRGEWEQAWWCQVVV